MTFRKMVLQITLFAGILTSVGAGCSPVPRAITPGLDGKVVVTFAAGPSQQPVYQPLIEAFNQSQPTIEVQFVSLGQDALADSVAGQLQSMASAADTSLLTGQTNIRLGHAYFQDLGPLLETEADFQPDDFWEGTLAGCQAGGASGASGIPLAALPVGILADRTAFAAAGLDLPQPGWTWDDFQEVLQALAGRLPDLQAPPFSDDLVTLDPLPSGNYLLEPLLDQALSASGSSPDPQDLQAQTSWYFDLVARGLVTPVQTVAAGGNQRNAWAELYPDGQPPLWIGTINSEPLNGKAHGSVTLLPFPVSAAGGDATTPLYPVCGMVSAGSTHPREAFTWLVYLSQHWDQLTGEAAMDTLPARKSLAEVGNAWQSLPQDQQAAYSFMLAHGWYGSSQPELLDQATVALVASLAQGADFSTTLANALARAPVLNETGAPASIQVATPPPQNDTGEPVTFFTYEVFGKQDIYQQLVGEFNSSHPGYRVQLPSFASQADFPGPDDDLFSFYANRYDCFEGDLSDFQPSHLDLVADLAPLLDREDKSFTDDFYPWLTRLFQVDGKVIGLPTSYQPEVMYYNAGLLQELGVPPPGLDWNFDDFMQLAAQASGQGPAGTVYGFVTYAPTDIYLLLAGRQVNWTDASTSLPNTRFDQPDVQAGFLWLQSLVQAGVLPFVTPLDGSETIQSLINSGQVAFWTEKIGADWGGWYIRPDNADLQIGAAPLPGVPGGSPVAANRVVGMFISSRSGNPQVCWEWIKFLSEKTEVTNGTPTRRSIVASPAWQNLVGQPKADVYRAVLAQGENSTIFNDHTLWFDLFYPGNQAYHDILNGQDASLALLAAQQKVDRLRDCLLTAGVTLENDRANADVLESCYLDSQGISHYGTPTRPFPWRKATIRHDGLYP